jgi:hypothetical protein
MTTTTRPDRVEVYDSRIGEKLAAAVVRLLLLLAGAVLAALLWRAS